MLAHETLRDVYRLHATGYRSLVVIARNAMGETCLTLPLLELGLDVYLRDPCFTVVVGKACCVHSDRRPAVFPGLFTKDETNSPGRKSAASAKDSENNHVPMNQPGILRALVGGRTGILWTTLYRYTDDIVCFMGRHPSLVHDSRRLGREEVRIRSESRYLG